MKLEEFFFEKFLFLIFCPLLEFSTLLDFFATVPSYIDPIHPSRFFLHLNSVSKTKQYMSHPSLKSAMLFFIFQSGLNVSVKLKPRQEIFPFSNMYTALQAPFPTQHSTSEVLK